MDESMEDQSEIYFANSDIPGAVPLDPLMTIPLPQETLIRMALFVRYNQPIQFS